MSTKYPLSEQQCLESLGRHCYQEGIALGDLRLRKCLHCGHAQGMSRHWHDEPGYCHVHEHQPPAAASDPISGPLTDSR